MKNRAILTPIILILGAVIVLNIVAMSVCFTSARWLCPQGVQSIEPGYFGSCSIVCR